MYLTGLRRGRPKDRVKIGLVGSGFAAALHMEAYKQVYGIEPWVAAVASPSERAGYFAR